MCKCTPEIRTPFCGRSGCEWPEQNKDRDIDKLIAEEIFGLSVQYGEATGVLRELGQGHERRYKDAIIPNYSGNMSAAWEVVDFITQTPKTKEAAIQASNVKFAIWFESSFLWAKNESGAAWAICIAALNAVGVEIGVDGDING